jgi:hypothetical protein
MHHLAEPLNVLQSRFVKIGFQFGSESGNRVTAIAIE